MLCLLQFIWSSKFSWAAEALESEENRGPQWHQPRTLGVLITGFEDREALSHPSRPHISTERPPGVDSDSVHCAGVTGCHAESHLRILKLASSLSASADQLLSLSLLASASLQKSDSQRCSLVACLAVHAQGLGASRPTLSQGMS